MQYRIVSGDGMQKFYLTGIEKGYNAEWDCDPYGRISKMIPKNGKFRSMQTVGNYSLNPENAILFKSRKSAEKKIQEYPVLRYCRVEPAEKGEAK